jgi:hypothetical protein
MSNEVRFPIKERAIGVDKNENGPKERQMLIAAWGKRHRPGNQYKSARNGDHALVPFECDLCIFRKLRGHTPDPLAPEDTLLMACLRRINLDAFWSRAAATVRGNKDKLAEGLQMLAAAGLSGPYKTDGPLPEFDHCGYEVAVQMVLESRKKGLYCIDRLQFDTIRKLRTVYFNHCRASAKADRTAMSLGNQKGKYVRFSTDACASFRCYRFLEGCKGRMGQDWRPNQVMSINLLLKVLSEMETWIEASETDQESNRWMVVNTYVTICYVVSLLGAEGLLVDLSGLNRKWGLGGLEYVTIALLGKIKGETGDHAHLLPPVPITSLGVQVEASLKRLMDFKARKGFKTGPAISDLQGQVFEPKALNDALLKILEDLFDYHRELFPALISTSKEMLLQKYQAFWTLRRTSDTRALEVKVAHPDIDLVNR